MIAALRLAGLLPRRVRKGIRALLGGSAHQDHWTHGLWAWHFARGSKRLDRVAGSLAHWLARAVGGVQGKACMEFGSGHLISEPLVLWLAGARRAVAVDYNPILRLGFARRAFVTADFDALRSSLTAIAPAELVEARIGALRAARWTLDGLAGLGIEYRAPLDFAEAPPFAAEFDLIHSTAVLEHLSGEEVGAILRNLQAAMRRGAIALHTIHLEDHRDFRRAPFAFLAADSDWRPADADSRGNRLRASDWVRAFHEAGASSVDVLWEALREDAPLPALLAPGFAAHDVRDLRVGSVLVAVRS